MKYCRVLVTGATGQIGSAVVRELVSRGYEVRCLVRESSDLTLINDLPIGYVSGLLSDIDSLRSCVHQVDAVIHAAGTISYWHKMKTQLVEVNCEGTKNLLSAAIEEGVKRFILTSSIATVGYNSNGVGNEAVPYNWHGMGIDYFDTKYESEQLVLNCKQIEGIAVNPGIVIGQNDLNRNGSRLLAQISRGKRIIVPSGTTTVSVLNDVANGHVLALENGSSGHRYILGGTIVSFLELYERIAAVLGKPAPTKLTSPFKMHILAKLLGLISLFSGKEPMLTPALVEIATRNRGYSSKKAMAELGYQPSPLENGVLACSDWHRGRGYSL